MKVRRLLDGKCGSFSISQGRRIGFIGTTGSCKSTLLDIVMGLLSRAECVLEIDDQPITAGNHRAWQARIAHVLQAIFLSDSRTVLRKISHLAYQRIA